MAEDSGTSAPMTAERLAEIREWFVGGLPANLTIEFARALLAEVDRLRAENEQLQACRACPDCHHETGRHLGGWCRVPTAIDRVCGCSAVRAATPVYGRVTFTNHPASEYTP